MYEIPTWQKVLAAVAVLAALSFAVIAYTWTPAKPAAPVAAIPPKAEPKKEEPKAEPKKPERKSDYDKDRDHAEKRDRKSHLREDDERAKREMSKIRDALRVQSTRGD
jgi:hypothetical protein